MKITHAAEHHSRREFLCRTSLAGLILLRPASEATAGDARPGTKPLNGVFPIGSTPFTESDKLDLDCLAAEVKFCNRTGVHGLAWPQIASGWTTLSESERLDGAEAILAAGKGGRTVLAIGVQDKAGSVDQAIKYARHAQSHGADAIVSLPPENSSDSAMLDYYKTLGAAIDLPLFVQTQGSTSVDLIVRMFQAIPTMKVVKDEAGNPLERITPLRQRTSDKLAVFSGNGVRTMIDEMRLGFAGHCPTIGLADLYQATWDLWHAGKHNEAFDMFGRIQAFGSIQGASAYVLVARGIFKESTKARAFSMGGGPARPTARLDEAQKKVIREALDSYLKPYLRA